MKISKRQLRRIIKEEKQKLLNEQKVRRIVRSHLTEQAGPNLPALARGKDLVPISMGRWMDQIGFAEAGSGKVVISGDQLEELTYDEATEQVDGNLWVPLVQQIMASANSTTFNSDELVDFGLSNTASFDPQQEPVFNDPGYSELYRSGKLVVRG